MSEHILVFGRDKVPFIPCQIVSIFTYIFIFSLYYWFSRSMLWKDLFFSCYLMLLISTLSKIGSYCIILCMLLDKLFFFKFWYFNITLSLCILYIRLHVKSNCILLLIEEFNAFILHIHGSCFMLAGIFLFSIFFYRK